MGLLSILERGIQAMIDEALTPQAFNRGRRFENYVRDVLFPKTSYDLIERAPKYDPHDFVEACLKPDFKFRDRKSGKEFYVEAKFRKSIKNGWIPLCKNMDQLDRYKTYQSDAPVFILLGFEGDEDHSRLLSLIPVYELRYANISYNYAKRFEIKNSEVVILNLSWSLKGDVTTGKKL